MPIEEDEPHTEVIAAVKLKDNAGVIELDLPRLSEDELIRFQDALPRLIKHMPEGSTYSLKDTSNGLTLISGLSEAQVIGYIGHLITLKGPRPSVAERYS